MRAFVVHDRDGNVVGMVRAQSDEAPPVVMSGTAGQMVTEIERPDDVEAVYTATDENPAVEAAQAFRVEVERRLVKK